MRFPAVFLQLLPMKNAILQYWNVFEAIALGSEVIFLSVRDYHAA